MCGIAGIFHNNAITIADIEQVEKFNIIQQHRGPDDCGIFHDASCVLGHKRLSIIDLSEAGHQPFFSDDKRYVMVYNGEIYNYIELRKQLKELGYSFKTATDTEVLLKAYLHYGKDCLARFNGMFAFVIYDSLLNKLFLARDRVGIKPLYYVIINSKFYFASELKALCAIPHIELSLNYKSLFDYLVFNRTDVFDETFYNKIYRLPKGHFAEYWNENMNIHEWWNPENYISLSPKDELNDINKTVHDIFVSSVNLRMRSDVPVGTCLSGGLDSSILLGILYNHNNAQEGYPTFTASFPGNKIDETEYIIDLKNRYPFKSYFVFPDSETAFNKLNEFVYMNDEPTTNPSFFSQYEVMKKASQNNVTVLLDGQGGDESFAGYQYFHGFNLFGLFKEKKYGSFSMELIKNVIRRQDKSAYQTFLFQILPDKIKKRMLLNTLPYIKPDFFYNYIDQSKIYSGFFNADSLNISLVRHFQYKLEHLLRMEDRNSMAFSLEARVPYLDHRLIEYLLGVASSLKIKDGETKYIQKQSLGKYTTQKILNRKDKIGFGTPGNDWMETKSWKKLTESNYDNLCTKFPEVFKKNIELPKFGFDRWKVNQLAVWENIFLN